MDEDRHKFQKSFAEDQDAESVEDKEKALLSQFAWDDTEEDSADECQPEYAAVSNIFSCVSAISKYVNENLKTEYAMLGEDDVALKMYIPVDELIHPLLVDRHAAQWTEESRLVVFESVQSVFRQHWDESARLEVEVALDDMFPFQGKKRHHIDSIELWDEPVSTESSNFGVEIKVSYVANVQK